MQTFDVSSKEDEKERKRWIGRNLIFKFKKATDEMCRLDKGYAIMKVFVCS